MTRTVATSPGQGGSLTSRQVIELLEEIERSGVYEALPALGLVAGVVDPTATTATTPIQSSVACRLPGPAT